jgi:hypothetical protein
MADNGRVIYTAHAPSPAAAPPAPAAPRTAPWTWISARRWRWAETAKGRTPRSASRSATPPVSRTRSGAARPRRIEVGDVAIDSSVMLMPTDSRGYALSLTLAVTLPAIHRVEAVELVQ